MSAEPTSGSGANATAGCIASTASFDALRSIPSPCAPTSWTGAGCRGLLAPWAASFPSDLPLRAVRRAAGVVRVSSTK